MSHLPPSEPVAPAAGEPVTGCRGLGRSRAGSRPGRRPAARV